MKKAHLLRCALRSLLRRINNIRLVGRLRAPCIWAFLISLFITGLFSPVRVLGQELGADGKELLLAAKKKFEEIRSYKCKATNVVMKYGMIKTSKYFNSVQYSFEKPKKIRIAWLDPLLLRGQVAVYNNSDLRVKLNFMPFAVHMDPEGLLAKDPAGNGITGTDMGHLIDTLLESITPGTQVRVEKPQASRAQGKDAELILIENAAGRVEILFDNNLTMPVAIDYYGADNRLEQACKFEEIQLNVEFTPEEFKLPMGPLGGAAS